MKVQHKSHRWINKYIAVPLIGSKYYLSFDFDRKLLWFRVAKCATRSIDEMLLGANYVYGPMQNYFPYLYKSWIKFTFIRNPIDRFKSCYKEKVLSDTPFISRYTDTQNLKNYFPKLSIDQFIDFIDMQNVDFPQTDTHICSQSSLINLDDIDFVGTVESFERDIRRIITDVKPKDIPHINKSKGLIVLTPSQESRLKIIYSEDFDLFEKVKNGSC